MQTVQARWRRAARLMLAVVISTWLLGASGCRMFDSKNEPQRPRTTTEWMKQPRPGNGVLGP